MEMPRSRSTASSRPLGSAAWLWSCDASALVRAEASVDAGSGATEVVAIAGTVAKLLPSTSAVVAAAMLPRFNSAREDSCICGVSQFKVWYLAFVCAAAVMGHPFGHTASNECYQNETLTSVYIPNKQRRPKTPALRLIDASTKQLHFRMIPRPGGTETGVTGDDTPGIIFVRFPRVTFRQFPSIRAFLCAEGATSLPARIEARGVNIMETLWKYSKFDIGQLLKESNSCTRPARSRIPFRVPNISKH